MTMPYGPPPPMPFGPAPMGGPRFGGPSFGNICLASVFSSLYSFSVW